MTAFHAAEPIYLWLLLILPLFWLAARRLRTVETGRRWLIIILRTLIILLFILALAKMEFVRQSKDLTVYFLLDQSDSIPVNLRERATQVISEFSKEKPANDEAGLIVFGDQPSLESTAVKTFEFEGQINSAIEGERTDIAKAMRLALAAFPNNRLRRMVLLSDGNENSGSALEIARLARNNNVPVDIVPLNYSQEQDVQIDKIIVPQQTAKDSPFDVKVFLSSKEDTEGRLRLYEDGKLIVDQKVEVSGGRNTPLTLPRRLEEGGFHQYSATFEAAGDARPQNNRAEAFTYLKAEPRVLYVEGDHTSTNYLAAALRLENIVVDYVSETEIPRTLGELQGYDSIILSDVHASSMTRDQMKMIERAVQDLGVGLVMIGGENSFGAGGYQDTPIERALPVSMDVKQKKVLPNGALVIVLHTCEIPSGNAWAREISIAALDVLSAQDYFGLLYYGQKPGVGIGGGMGGWGEFWLWDPGLQQAGDKRRMRAMINNVSPMDMPTFDPTLELAYEELKDVKTQAKHIVVISDGDPAPPQKPLVNKIRDEGITVSAVAIAPHAGQTVETLKNMSYWGAGNFYYPKTARELPRIFVKEASIVRRSLIFEETFAPKYDVPSEILEGIPQLPALNGYVVTSDKDLATYALRTDKDDPLLAHWRYGLGKTVAFTSDAKSRWAAQWVSWDGYSKFWSQVVRFSLRETSSSNFQVNTELQGGRGKITIDALELDGGFRNFLEFNTTVIGPDLEPHKAQIRQVAPGRYEGEFEANQVGTYMVSMVTGEEESPELITSGVALSYSPEYQATQTNDTFLEKIAKESGGREMDAQYNPFDHTTLVSAARPQPIWPWLLFAGLLLLPLDIFLRRVYLDFAELWAGAQRYAVNTFRIITFRSPKRIEERDAAMDNLMAAKRRATADKEREREEQEARKKFRERLGDTEQSDGSVFANPDEQAPKGPVRHRSKQTVSPTEGRGESGQTGMGSLLEAKKRARKKMK
ncbi:VWA domain-containing protein [bacterium]|nr:VWA domain-containing protein [bacterium]